MSKKTTIQEMLAKAASQNLLDELSSNISKEKSIQKTALETKNHSKETSLKQALYKKINSKNLALPPCAICNKSANTIRIPDLKTPYKFIPLCRSCNAKLKSISNLPTTSISDLKSKTIPQTKRNYINAQQYLRRHLKAHPKNLKCQLCNKTKSQTQIINHIPNPQDPLIFNSLCRSCLYKIEHSNLDYPKPINLYKEN